MKKIFHFPSIIHLCRLSNSLDSRKTITFHWYKIHFFSELVCSTESGPTPGIPCIFPFELDGVAYHTCKLDEKDGSRWCSTKIDKNGQHLPGNWGNCGSDCGEHIIQGPCLLDTNFLVTCSSKPSLIERSLADQRPIRNLAMKIAKFWLSKSTFYVKNHPNHSNFFFHWRIWD